MSQANLFDAPADTHEPVRILTLAAENVKTLRAVMVDCSTQDVTVIGGKNGAGKTSVLDAIMYALGGEGHRPTSMKRAGAISDPVIRVELSNGWTVERKGKNSALKVTAADGQKLGQMSLKQFVEEIALNLPKFLHASNAGKAQYLLQIIGVADELAVLEAKAKSIYDERKTAGQIATNKAKHAEECEHFPSASSDRVDVSGLIEQSQAIVDGNAYNAIMRRKESEARYNIEAVNKTLDDIDHQMAELLSRKIAGGEKKNACQKVLDNAIEAAAGLVDKDTRAIAEQIRGAEAVNEMVAANVRKVEAQAEAKTHKNKYDDLTANLEAVRREKKNLLEGADLPLPGLGIADGELTYKGVKWDCMSGSDQLKIATAVCRKVNPECGFVLVDGLEQMDSETLAEFVKWVVAEGLQVVGTRVSVGDECTLIIEDGTVKEGK